MKTSISSILSKFVGALIIAFVLANVVQTATGLPIMVGFTLVMLLFFAPKPAHVFGSGSLDLTELSATLTDYVLENKTSLFFKIVNGAMFDWMTPIGDVTDKVPLVEILVGDLLQPGGKNTFTPTDGAVQFKNRFAQVRPGKADLQFTQVQLQQLRKSWIGFMAKQEAAGVPKDVYYIPFEAYIMTKVVERFNKNLREAIIKGTYNASGTGKLDVMDGLLTLVGDDVTSLDIPAANVFAGAAITESNAEAQVAGVAKKALSNEDYAGADMVMLISPLNKYNYEINYRANHGSLPYNNTFAQGIVPGTNIVLFPVPELTGSNRLIVTPKENICLAYDDLNRANSISVEKEQRNVNMLIDVELGMNYAIAETIWTNDQA
jgi:hypothetical protein